jgi:NADPH-dependent 2,4-dienoyl-CoA reductase/sulfur reductase-like enzyme/pSer/pThr/pTyr-binding forkhead associated (FHA) protein
MAERISYVIIGNGIAGVTAAEILRSEDSAAGITVIADDPFPVYYRPALKDYLAGRVREDKLWARPSSFYQQQNIRFLPERVVAIQAGQHTVQLQSGRQIAYSRLLLANGARPSRLTCPGLDLAGVTTLRTVGDYQGVLSRLITVRRVVVSGSGTLALETIETLHHRGYHVTHLLRRRTLWSEVLDATASDLVLQQERRDSIDVRSEEEIAEITGKQGQVTGVVTTQGRHIPCELVVIAIGVEPIIDFIKASGIPCGRGVKVDAAMRTGAPDIYAAGDVLETTDKMTGRTRVLGQWYPSVQQARAAAYSMLDLLDTGRPFRTDTFYNATFLYGLDFASVGLTNIPRGGSGYQEIVADPQPRTYRKVLLKDGMPVGMLSLGDRKGALAFKRAIDHRVNLMPVASTLFAEHFKLNDWLDQQNVPLAMLGVSRAGDIAIKQAAYTGAALPTLISIAKPLSEALLIPVAHAELSQLAETQLSQTKVMVLGRQAGVYLLIDHPSVSRRHAELSYANGQYVLHDLGSTNGTFVNDTRMEPGSTHILNPGDQMRLGKIARFVFQLRSVGVELAPTHSSSAPTKTTLHQMKTGIYDVDAVDQAPPPLGQPILNAGGSLLLPGASSAIPAGVVATLNEAPALIVVTRGMPEVFLLQAGKRVILGRDKKADIVLADVVVSRRHAEVFQGPDGFYIHDLGSSNGIIVNQARIDNPYLLSHGDRITIGSLMIYFMNAGARLIADIEERPVVPQSAQSNKKCHNCGASNTSIARFCTTCGTSL